MSNYISTSDPFNNVSTRYLNDNTSEAAITPGPVSDSLNENLTSEFNSQMPHGENCGTFLPPPLEPVLKRVQIPNLKIPLDIFGVIELILLIYFTLDLVLRLFACPCIIRYFSSVVNVTDALALLGAYVHLALLTLLPREKRDASWVVVVQMLQMFRSFRFFRVVVGFNISKVLAFSLAQNIKDLLIMFVYLFAGMCIFSTLLYIVENADTIDSIPSGMYWAVVTMTTVGYGDIVPQSKTGRLIGGVCAVSGVMMFALAVPLVVNHFITLYQYVGLEELETLNKGDNCGDEEDRVKNGDGTPEAVINRRGSSNREMHGLNIV